MQKIGLALLFLWAGAASALDVNPARTLQIVGRIDDGLLPLAAGIELLSQESSDPIDILIDSHGGAIAPTHIFLNAMNAAKGRGITIRCTVTNDAQSAAFYIFANCSERYAFPWAQMMWHQAWVKPGRINANGAEMLAAELRQMDAAFKALAVQSMGVSGDFYDLHSTAETNWVAASLSMVAPGFMQIIASVQPSNLFQHFMPQEALQNGTPAIRTP
jgi:ATP-dependent protease ClpP protease subunit